MLLYGLWHTEKRVFHEWSNRPGHQQPAIFRTEHAALQLRDDMPYSQGKHLALVTLITNPMMLPENANPAPEGDHFCGTPVHGVYP